MIWIGIGIGLVVGFIVGWIWCAVISTGKCSDCILKEYRDFEEKDSNYDRTISKYPKQ